MDLKRVKGVEAFQKDQERMLAAVERNMDEILDLFAGYWSRGASRDEIFNFLVNSHLEFKGGWHPFECIAWYVRSVFPRKSHLLK
jgi:hypothetical protein